MTRPRKQTSSRVSTLAARLMRRAEAGDRFYVADHIKPWRDITRDVLMLCASALSQDETSGQAKKRKRRR